MMAIISAICKDNSVGVAKRVGFSRNGSKEKIDNDLRIAEERDGDQGPDGGKMF